MFIGKGHHTKNAAPSGFKKIIVNFIFDDKNDGRHKARLVADGHLSYRHSSRINLLRSSKSSRILFASVYTRTKQLRNMGYRHW